MSKWALTVPIWIAIGGLFFANVSTLNATTIAAPNHMQSNSVSAISQLLKLDDHVQSLRFPHSKSSQVLRIRPGPVAFQTIYQGAGHAPAGATEINDPAAWSAFWQQNCSICQATIISNNSLFASNPSPTPHIDFVTRTIIVVSPGLEGNPGVQININNVTDHEHHIFVDATRTNPGSDCVEIQVVTFPVQIIVVPKTDLSPILDMGTVQGPPCPL